MRAFSGAGCSHAFIRFRFVLQWIIDATAWVVGLVVAVVLRYEFHLDLVGWEGLATVALLAAAGQLAVGRSTGLYIRRWRYGTFEELMACGRSVLLVGTVLGVGNLVVLGHPVPVSATIAAPLIALVLMSLARTVWRLHMDSLRRPDSDRAEPVVIFGAGDGGHQLVRALEDPASPYLPIVALDDNPGLRGHRMRHVPVVGGREELAEVVARHGVTTMVIAIPSAGSELIRDLSAMADQLGLTTRILPRVSSLLDNGIGISDIRPITEADLLGRREIHTDLEAVAGYLTGKRVLVTGAGGSIGSELCRQIHRFAPSSLILLDRDESALQAVEVSLDGRGQLSDDTTVVACIRDEERMREVFEWHRPEVVFHAAALKHVPLLELHPQEGWKTNVWGTHTLLRVAGEFGVERFVNISTDKAAEPTNTLGLTKRLAERLTAAAGARYSGTYLSVRFGNVLGSRGSVVPLFRKQIEAGGPVTVTHPDVTRFFMTIEEACQLVIQAGAVGDDGQVLVLNMGEPVPILEVAKRLVAESKRPVPIIYTGLRPGEKMHEVLFGDHEMPRPSSHDLISLVDVPPIEVDGVRRVEEAVVRIRQLATAPTVDLRSDVLSMRMAGGGE